MTFQLTAVKKKALKVDKSTILNFGYIKSSDDSEEETNMNNNEEEYYILFVWLVVEFVVYWDRLFILNLLCYAK